MTCPICKAKLIIRQTADGKASTLHCPKCMISPYNRERKANENNDNDDVQGLWSTTDFYQDYRR